MDPRIGTEVAGYRIESVLGRGGMGVVYVARHLRLDRTVALKVVSPELAEDPKFRDRFVRESRLAASLEHPNIVPIHDAGEADGVLYLAMRLVSGTDLKSLIAEDGGLDPGRTVRLLDQAAGALDAAHQAGLVHRDVKPGNVLVASPGTSGEHAYLSDFGLTKRMTSDSGLTRTGQFVGTLDYAAPEQFEGKRLDGRADVYSLGCVLYECLTGDIPFRRDNQAALVYAHLMADPPKVTEKKPELPEAIDAVLAKGMAKKPEERYPTAGELVGDVRAVLEPSAVSGGPLLGSAPSRPKGRIAIAAGAAILAAAIALVSVLLRYGGAGPSHGPSPSSSRGLLAASDHLARISQATAGEAFARLVQVKAGKGPKAVAVSGESVWVANQDDNTVSRIDPATNQKRVIRVGIRPSLIAVGEGSVWVANRVSHNISRIDPGTNTVKATIDIAGAAFPDSLAVGEGSVWIGVSGGLGSAVELHRIDIQTNRDVAAIPIVTSGLWVLTTTGEGSVWAVAHSGKLLRVDPKTTETHEVSNLGTPAAGITMADGKLWVASLLGEVLEVDPSTGAIEARAPGGGSPGGIHVGVRDPGFDDLLAITAGQGIIWVTDKLEGRISRIVATDSSVLEPLRTGQTPTGLAVGFDSVWVTIDASGPG